MKKIILLLLCGVMLVGCTSKTQNTYESSVQVTDETEVKKIEAEQQIQNLYDTDDLVVKSLGEDSVVQFQIPEAWDNGAKEDGNITYYFYDKLMFVPQQMEVNYSNDELIAGVDSHVEGFINSFDECSEKEINIVDISNIEVVEFLAEIKLNNKNLIFKNLAFSFDKTLYSFSFYIEKNSKKDYVAEYESFKESIWIQDNNAEITKESDGVNELFEGFKQNIIDSAKNLGSTDIEKQMYYDNLVASLPYVKVLTEETWNDSDEFNKFLLAIGYFYTHYDNGTKGHEIGEKGFLIAEVLMAQGKADIEEAVLHIEELLSKSKNDLSLSIINSEEIVETVDKNSENIEPIQLTTGMYVVGEDIPAGKYDIVGIEQGNVYVNSPGKSYGDIVSEMIKPGETTYVNVRLENGYTVEVVLGGKIELQPK